MSNETDMNSEQFEKIMQRFEAMDSRFEAIDGRFKNIEDNMVRKSDVFQSVLTVQGFTAAIIVGCIVVLNSLGAFG